MYVVENPTTVVSPSVDITTLWWDPSDTLDLNYFDLLLFISTTSTILSFQVGGDQQVGK